MSCAAATVLSVAQPGSGLHVPMSMGSRPAHLLLMTAVVFGTEFVPVRRQLASGGPNDEAPLSFPFWPFVPPLMISFTTPASALTIASTQAMRSLLVDRLALPAVVSWLLAIVPSISGKTAPAGSLPS